MFKKTILHVLCVCFLSICSWCCLESYLWRPINKYNYYRMAKSKSIQKNKQLIVIGDPYSGSPLTRFLQNLLRNINFELYGCGDYCIDLTGCPKCKTGTNTSLDKALTNIPSNSGVVFTSCTLEFVNADMKRMLDDLIRIAGNDIYVVTVKNLNGHYGYECVDNRCAITLNNIFTQKSSRFISKAPPEYPYFEWTDKNGVKEQYSIKKNNVP